jgi:hypothetical protein
MKEKSPPSLSLMAVKAVNTYGYLWTENFPHSSCYSSLRFKIYLALKMVESLIDLKFILNK